MAYVYVAHVGPIVKRQVAVAAGYPRHFTGRPCKHGHLSERHTANGSCIACCRASTWAADNKERHDAYTEEYRRANAARLLEKSLEWRAANRERFDANAAAWQKANRSSINARLAAWKKANHEKVATSRHIRERENADLIKAQRTALRMANPLRWKCYAENRRARKLAAGGTHTPAQVAALAVAQKHKCPGCGVSIKAGFEADHIVALSKGGGNDISNIQLLCKPCNRSKHNKDPIDWARANGRLL